MHKSLFLSIAIMPLCVVANVAFAGQYMAHADFSGCPSQYITESSGDEGPFDSKEACQVRIDSVKNSLACAEYSCVPVGEDSNADSGSSSSAPPTPQGLIQESTKNVAHGIVYGNSQQTGVGLFGLTTGLLLPGLQRNPQQEAQQRREEAAREAEQRAEEERQAQEEARKQEQIKDQLLGEPGGGNSDSLHLMGVTQAPNLQLMTGDQALAPIGVNTANSTTSKTNVKFPDAFNRGYHDSSQCYSESTTNACPQNLSGQDFVACHHDYVAGYDVGTKEEEMKITKAAELGRLDAESGRPDNVTSVTNGAGDCQADLNNAYESGYHFRSDSAQ